MGSFDRRGWRVLVALLMAASAMGAVALFPPEASDAVAGDSAAIVTTVTGGPTGEAVIPGRMHVDRPSGVERGPRVKGLVLVATLTAAALAHETSCRRNARRHTQSDPPVLLRTLSAPRRGPPPLQFA
jgi:hypothetical protein